MNPKYVAIAIIVLAVLASAYLLWTDQTSTDETLEEVETEQQLEGEGSVDGDSANLQTEDGEMQILPIATDEFAENNWVLSAATVNNSAVSLSAPVPQALTLNFDKDTKSYSGFGGCNNFSGKYTISGMDEFSFGATVSTKMACQDTMNLETEIFKGMSNITNFAIIDDMLTLTSEDEETKLVYKKAI